MVSLAFWLPGQAGAGEHWPVSTVEAEAIAERVIACLDSIPGKRKSQLLATVDKAAPWAGLAVTLYAVAAPRVQATILLRGRPRSAPTAAPASASAPANGEAPRREEVSPLVDPSGRLGIL